MKMLESKIGKEDEKNYELSQEFDGLKSKLRELKELLKSEEG